MTPKRLLPFLAVFVVLAGAYLFLEWHQGKVARDEAEAKKIFVLKEPDIAAITIKRGPEDIRLVKEGAIWRLDQPLQDRADALTLNSLLAALSQMRFTRNLGPEKDLKPFGLDEPPLVVSFTAGDKTHTLNVGSKAPGGQGYYARRDQDPQVLLIAASTRESLDRPLADLRNRALFDFNAEQVKALRVKIGVNQVALEKKGDAWELLGREPFKIYPDRLQSLLRYISLARVKEFVPPPLKDLKTYGLAPPALEITVVTDKGEQSLALGSRHQAECYARQGEQGPVVLIESLLLDFFTSPLESVAGLRQNPLWEHVHGAFPNYLQDRRLWTGEAKDVAGLTWGPPGKIWTAAKSGDMYKLDGPDKQELKQPAIRVELALLKLRDLEVDRLAPAEHPDNKAKNTVVLKNAAGQAIFHLDDIGAANGQVMVRYSAAESAPREVLVLKTAYDRWQKDMTQLTVPPPASETKSP
jgi:hypothetical protein